MPHMKLDLAPAPVLPPVSTLPKSRSPAALNVLIAEDDRDVMEMLQLHLKKAGGFLISSAADGATALRMAREQLPDVIVLDLMLPKMSGLEVCRSLKATPATANIAILILTAKAEEIDRIVGLELGADDYVTKPFSPREVILRIRSVVRRGANELPEEKLSVGLIAIDLSRHEVTVARKLVRLTSVEFKLLAMLMHRRGRVQSRDSLLKEVWGYATAVIDTRTVDTHVRRLRKKLGKAGNLIETVRGFGYRLREE
jgi:two-component system phosphate regulon response regulator PhoB